VEERCQKLVEKQRRPDDASLRRVTAPLEAEAVLEAAAQALGVEVGEFQRRRRKSVLRGLPPACW